MVDPTNQTKPNMKTVFLGKTDKEITNANVVLICDYTDVALATSTVAVNALSVLAGHKVQVVGIRLKTPFDITGTGNLTLSVGDGSSATALSAAIQVALDDTEILYSAGGSAKTYTVDDTVDLFWTASSMAYTSGEVAIYLAVDNLNDWATV
jgi:hypothetical protein